MSHIKACIFHGRPILLLVSRGGYTDGCMTGYRLEYICDIRNNTCVRFEKQICPRKVITCAIRPMASGAQITFKVMWLKETVYTLGQNGGNIKLLSWHSWFFHYYCTVLSHFEMRSKWWLHIIISTSSRRKIANEILPPFWLTVCSLWLTEPQWVVIHGFVVVETAIELSRFKLPHCARWTEFINFSHL